MTIDLIYVLQHHTRKRATKKKAQSQQSIVKSKWKNNAALLMHKNYIFLKDGVEYHSMGKIAEK